MTILVGYPIKRRAKAVLSLAGMLARSSGEDLLVCAVIPAPWMPGLSRADQGYRSYIDESADGAVAQARADLPPTCPQSSPRFMPGRLPAACWRRPSSTRPA